MVNWRVKTGEHFRSFVDGRNQIESGLFHTEKSEKTDQFSDKGRHNGRNDNNFLMNDTAALFFVPDSFPRLSAREREKHQNARQCKSSESPPTFYYHFLLGQSDTLTNRWMLHQRKIRESDAPMKALLTDPLQVLHRRLFSPKAEKRVLKKKIINF
jgi:hypothetical protein